MATDGSLFQEAWQRRRSEGLLSKMRHELQSFERVEVREDLRVARELMSAWEALSEASLVDRGSGGGCRPPRIEVFVVPSVEELMVQLSSLVEWEASQPVIFVPGGDCPSGVVAVRGEPSTRFIDWAARWMESGGLIFSQSRSMLILIDWLEGESVYEMQAAEIRI